MTRLRFPVKFTKLFVNNQFVDSVSSGATRDLLSPATERVIATVTEASTEDVHIAVQSAHKALPAWSAWSGMDRRDFLLKLADRVESNIDELSYLETICMGKPLADSKVDVRSAINILRYFAGFADKIHSTYINSMFPNASMGIRKSPVGVVGVISSFNYPLELAIWKLAPALACGNAVILKPPVQAPLSILFLADLFRQIEGPSGILSVLPGAEEAGKAIAMHDLIDKVSFTGSGVVGKSILKSAADSNLKQVTLELGGKSPIIVFPDADLQKAVDEVYLGIFTNMGENCCAGSRLYLHKSIHDEFLQSLKAKTESTARVGDPLDDAFNFGPMVDKRQFEKVMSFIERGRKAGYKILTGGKRVGDTGFFIQPTIFYDLPDDSFLLKEEIFGPVLSIGKPFDTVDEAIAKANDTEFGLAAGAFTQNISTSEKFIQKVRAGVIWINTYNIIPPCLPFGGIKGGSGFGKDLGEEAINEFTCKKSVYISH